MNDVATHNEGVEKRYPAIAALITGLLLIVVYLVLVEGSGCVIVFGRIDVLLCWSISSVPFSYWAWSQLPKPSGVARFLVASLLVFAALALGHMMGQWLPLKAVNPVQAIFGRTLMSFGITSAGVLIWMPGPNALDQDSSMPRWMGTANFPKGLFVVGLIGVIVSVPSVYCDSVVRGMQQSLEKNLQDQRVLRAEMNLRRLQQLRPWLQIRQTDLSSIAVDLVRWREGLEQQLNQDWGDPNSIHEIGRRVTALIQLDRNAAALNLIRPLMTGNSFHPISLDYAGLCYQRLGRFDESLQAYQQSIDHWMTQPVGASRQSAVASGWKGVAYAARQLDLRKQEEDAYRELVRWDPSARHHQLLAQCYRDHQKSTLAAKHATIAAELDPALDQERRSMLSTLARDHFHCWLVPSVRYANRSLICWSVISANALSGMSDV